MAEERSFRSAALRMHISQSALSVQVQHLERALGVPLFYRTTRSVALTREGLVLAGVARRVSNDLLEAAIALREEAELLSGSAPGTSRVASLIGLNYEFFEI